MSSTTMSAKELQQRVRETETALDQLRVERAKLDSAIAGWEARREKVAEQVLRVSAAESGLRRSTMSPLQKSRFIREYTKAVYDPGFPE